MTRRTLPHIIAAGLLTALLALPGPAMAQPLPHRAPVVELWSWLAGFWSRGVESLEGEMGMRTKGGARVDAGGGAGGTATSDGGDTHQGDNGLGIDPNG